MLKNRRLATKDKTGSRKLLFHIGHHKTGSTSLQEALATGGLTLADQKVLYPGRMAHNYLRRHFDQFLRTGKAPEGAVGFPSLEQISERMARHEFDITIISGEEFEGAKPQETKIVMQKFLLPHVTDYAVICYVRPHAARLLSSFAEQVKLGIVSTTLDQFVERNIKSGRFSYYRRLLGWANTFKGHFKLRPMIRSQLSGGSVIHDFFETGLGPDCKLTVQGTRASNESLCLEDLVLLKLAQGHLSQRNRQVRHAMGWDLALAFAEIARPQSQGTRLMLHKALAERIRRAYLDDAVALDHEFFASKPLMRDELDRAVDEALPQPQSLEPTDHFSPETLRAVSVFGKQLNRMLDHKRGPWNSFLLEGRIARLHDRTNQG